MSSREQSVRRCHTHNEGKPGRPDRSAGRLPLCL